MASRTDKATLVPPLPDFADAVIRESRLGPGRELTLVLRPNIRGPVVGGRAEPHHGEPITVHFREVTNFSEVQDLFDPKRNRQCDLDQRSELAWLRYDPHRPSKPGALFLELACERVDVFLTIQCASVRITEAPVPPPA